MEKAIYGLCALTALACGVVLLRSYFKNRFGILLWSGLCFAGLSVNNVLLVLDRTVFLDVDLSNWRNGVALASIVVLVTGLILEPDA
jgi:hypothetical protein